jgi:hypothetical protein
LLTRLAAAAILTLGLTAPLESQRETAAWPAIASEQRPWTRWWWLGSAVDPAGITAELETLRAAGIGGVEITPIYGVVGHESRHVEFLSEGWMRLLAHTVREARRLGLGVDMATGTGWPFGGPWVDDAHSTRSISLRTWTVEAGQRLSEPVRFEQPPLLRAIGMPGGSARRPAIADVKDPVETNANLQALAIEQVRFAKPLPLLALMAYAPDRAPIDLTGAVRPDGTLDWTAPPGRWTLHGLFLGWHGKMVERAAPGGEGMVIDHFARDAIRRYLARFDRAFAGGGEKGVRAFFNDSYEVDDAQGQGDGTPALLDEFRRRRGYDLRLHLPALAAPPADASDLTRRVRADYRQTIADLLLETFTNEWSAWARGRGARTRNQAHGSPGNLLDLYAATDIPETEGDHVTRFAWATSAAHVAGRPLVSAEAATWLDEHFRSTLADVRAAVDTFFVAGVNHIVYHGTAYSPASAPYPGWLFYAAVEFNTRNPWWKHFPALNEYVARTQSFLQSGKPDHDVLVYYPFYESLAVPRPARLAHFGNANQPAEHTGFETVSAGLRGRGFTHDYISDRQLAATRVTAGRLVTGGGATYNTLVLPDAAFIPVETFAQILALARAGAIVIAHNALPRDVPGVADLDARRARLAALRDGVSFGAPDAAGIREARTGNGRILMGPSLEPLLARAGIVREALVDRGLEFVRRTGGEYPFYFLRNPTDRDIDDWIPLGSRAAAATIFDPMTGALGTATTRRAADGSLEVRLVLRPAESLIVATARTATGTAFAFHTSAGDPVTLPGPWQVAFVDGGPQRPADRTLTSLTSWTAFGGDAGTSFSGIARYRTTFAAPANSAASWQIDLGRVRDSARVMLNGRDLGTLIGPTFRVTIDRAQLRPENVLEVEVANLMANRMAAMDRSGARWKIFYNVNFPSRLPQNRGPDNLFTAAAWEPLESGLIGPVTLRPVTTPDAQVPISK